MNKAKNIALKHVLWGKIKRLGALWGEDPILYAIEVYNENLDNLEGAVMCFSDLVEQAERIGRNRNGKNER